MTHLDKAKSRQDELDEYEARYGKYVQEHGPFNMIHLTIGVQGFAIYWEDDPEENPEANEAQRRWMKRMLCCALHDLVEAEK